MTIQEEIDACLTHLFHEIDEHQGKKDLFVLGCSTSRVRGSKIGKDSDPYLGRTLYESVANFLDKEGVPLAVQCCEHLNRALVVEREIADMYHFEIVNAVPHEHAGGAVARAAYDAMEDPVLVEFIEADCGLDIGLTSIGMHIRHVQVPVHFEAGKIGEAPAYALWSRPKYIGGPRTHYKA